jgi:hypothetical protein
MQSDLVFRGAHQECAHNSEKISRFAADLVFRDVPGKSVQRSGHAQRLRRPLLCVTLLKTICGRVVRVLRSPPSLGLFPSRRLALRLTARALTPSDPRIGTEPAAANGTGSLLGSGHRDSSSLCPNPSVGRSGQAGWVILREHRWETFRERRSTGITRALFSRSAFCFSKGNPLDHNHLCWAKGVLISRRSAGTDEPNAG